VPGAMSSRQQNWRADPARHRRRSERTARWAPTNGEAPRRDAFRCKRPSRRFFNRFCDGCAVEMAGRLGFRIAIIWDADAAIIILDIMGLGSFRCFGIRAHNVSLRHVGCVVDRQWG
jgi:hypothetical protein